MNSGGYSKISESVNYLHAHYTENDFRVEKLYEIAKISSRYYEKLFFQKFGETPKEYILKLKIESPKELLLSEKTLIKDIALKLGYSDIYHFVKIFKKKTGYTPGQYRKNVLHS
jgi:AraC-like DNA-binding protein